MILRLTFYLFVLLIFPLNPKKVIAQIIPDNTLPVNSQVENGCTICEINGGTTRGVNLYHSFQEFSVTTNGQALFNNGSEIQNILTRVTGNSISNIDGLIRTNGSANLFLINPNGITFGSNATVNIGGSFTATTANRLEFFNGSEFSATNPEAPPLLTISITPGLQYGQIQTGAKITNLGSLDAAQDLTMIADQLDLQGNIKAGKNLTFQATTNLAIQDSIISANQGNLNINTGELNITNTNINTRVSADGGEIAIQASDSATLTNSNLKIESIVGETPGIINIEANQLTIQDQSLISAAEESTITINANTVTLNNQSQIGTNTTIGTSGDIEFINLQSLQLTNSSEISANTQDGQAGDIIVSNSNFITLNNSRIASEALGSGDAGFVDLSTGEFTMVNGAQINVSSPDDAGILRISANTLTLDQEAKIEANTRLGIGGNIDFFNLKSLQLTNNSEISAITTDGSGGDITINASDFINIDSNSFISSASVGEGTAGLINITTGEINISNEANINVNSQDKNAGNLTIAANTINLDQNAKIQANTLSGMSGDIELLNLKSLQLSNDSSISATTTDGTAGNITINISDFINLQSNSRIASEAVGNGEAGFINITTGELNITDQGIISVNSNNKGGFLLLRANNVTLDNQAEILGRTVSGIGGDIELLGLTSLKLTNRSMISASTTNGEAGNITINANNLQLSNNSSISAGTTNGIAGNMTINVSDFINLNSGSRIGSAAIGNGEAGFIDITTGELTISDQGIINVSSDNIGGFLRLTANNVTLNNQGEISGTTLFGSGTNIELLELTSLQISNTSLISVSTINGEAGNVTINASDFIKLENFSRIASEAMGEGAAGSIEMTTGQFTISNSAGITVRSKDKNSGNLIINAKNLILDRQSQINGETSSGIGGSIELQNLTSLQLSNNSFISASTIDGEAGDIIINASDFIKLENFSRIASEARGLGDAGFIEMTTGEFNIGNRSIATVSSPQGQAGFLTITANNLSLNEGRLTAETGMGETGENAIINLFVQDLLLMRNNSRISAQAFNTAQGGNININAQSGFVVAFPFENSDINANANQGNGGDIDITTQAIFGIENRAVNTPKSDITASSQFGLNGDISIETLEVDPTQGILSLPTNLLDISNQIAEGCGSNSKLASRDNKFTVTGKGGLPYAPNDLFPGTNALVNLADSLPNQQSQENIKSVSFNNTLGKEIVEAQGWLIDGKGRIHLVAKGENVQPQNPVLPAGFCSFP